MQDWGYVWYGKFDVTIEVSNTKWPSASQLPTFWNDNLESMLAYLERVNEGLRGLVTDAVTGAPIAAEIYLDSDPFPVHTDPDVGDYHRLVLPGSYSMQVRGRGYRPQTISVAVPAGSAARYDVAMLPLPTDLQPFGSRIQEGLPGNGLLDPGETADVALTLMNMGAEASGITARLVPAGWDAEIVRGTAVFPDISNQATEESIAPHYALHVDGSVPEGRKLGFAVEWTADQGSGISEPFFVDVGAATCETVEAADVPKSIVDFGTTTSQLQFGSASLVSEIRVGVEIDHTYIGDLTVTLESPSGTRVVLHDRSGSSADDIVGTYGLDLNPAEPLTVLNGEPANGTWTLEVRDDGNGDNGSLDAWELEICGWAAALSPPEMRFRGLTVESGGVRLDWWPYPDVESYRIYRSMDPSSSAAFLDLTSSDGDVTDTTFKDSTAFPGLYFYLVTGVGEQGEGPKGHFGE
jgi:subtilisin-like proprotein convertase family protein